MQKLPKTEKHNFQAYKNLIQIRWNSIQIPDDALKILRNSYGTLKNSKGILRNIKAILQQKIVGVAIKSDIISLIGLNKTVTIRIKVYYSLPQGVLYIRRSIFINDFGKYKWYKEPS